MRKFLIPYLPASLLLVFLAMILSTCDGGGGGDGNGGIVVTLAGLAINGPSSVHQSSTTTYTATASWSNGATSIVTPSWDVNPETYASISASGVLTTLPVPGDQTVVVSAAYLDGGITETDTREVTIVEQPLDNVLLLDGVDDRAVAAKALTPSGVPIFTAEAWIYPTRAADMYILSDDPLDVFVDFEAGAANNGLGVGFLAWNQTCSASTGTTVYRDISLNQWNHVAVMYDASQFTISINGNFGTDPPTVYNGTFCSNNNYQFTVGGFYDSNNMAFQGEIDDVRVSSVVRYVSNFTPQDFFAADASTIGLWHFNEPVGSTSFSDSSSYGNTLTGINGAQTN